MRAAIATGPPAVGREAPGDEDTPRRLTHARPEGAAVAFLASDHAAYITGQVLGVDGGLAMM
jgi:NAD(P)-dependent dehydrogenase (short-subunit alcohol dehydrogenase family)